MRALPDAGCHGRADLITVARVTEPGLRRPAGPRYLRRPISLTQHGGRRSPPRTAFRGRGAGE